MNLPALQRRRRHGECPRFLFQGCARFGHGPARDCSPQEFKSSKAVTQIQSNNRFDIYFICYLGLGRFKNARSDKHVPPAIRLSSPCATAVTVLLLPHDMLACWHVGIFARARGMTAHLKCWHLLRWTRTLLAVYSCTCSTQGILSSAHLHACLQAKGICMCLSVYMAESAMHAALSLTTHVLHMYNSPTPNQGHILPEKSSRTQTYQPVLSPRVDADSASVIVSYLAPSRY